MNLIGWDNVKIILIEEYNLENRDQQMKEDKIIQEHINDNLCLNSCGLNFICGSLAEKEERGKYMEQRRLQRQSKKHMN